jgi:hypothetical protein
LYISEEVRFVISDINGKALIKTDKAVRFINIGNLAPGVYLIRFEDNTTQKFVKQ